MSPKDTKYHFSRKILIRQIIGETFIAAIDELNHVADQTLYIGILKSNSKYSLEFILGVMNSRLCGYFFRKYYSEEDDLFPKIKVNELKRLPFKAPTVSQEKEIEKSVDQILCLKRSDPTADTSALEAEIDRIVYALYGLTEEEVAVIENEE